MRHAWPVIAEVDETDWQLELREAQQDLRYKIRWQVY